MKQVSTFINMFLAAVIVFLLLSSNLPQVQAQQPTPVPVSPTATSPSTGCDSTRSVQVTGSALINVTPDRALIQLGVQSTGLTVELVQFANDLATQKLISALKAEGIDAKDISTDVYMVEPIYEDYNSLHVKGYRINNTLAVTVRDVKKTSAILATSLKAGANQINQVEFYTSELRKYRDEARALAMKAAQEKARALAQAVGSDAGCVLSINENSWSYYNGWWWGRWGGNQAQNVWTQNTVQNAAPANNAGSGTGTGGEEPISLGQISVKAEVSASFGLK